MTAEPNQSYHYHVMRRALDLIDAADAPLSLDDLVIASFVAGPSSTTLPIKIFSSVRLGVSPEINALSTILILIVAVGTISASLVTKRAVKRRQAEEQMAAG